MAHRNKNGNPGRQDFLDCDDIEPQRVTGIIRMSPQQVKDPEPKYWFAETMQGSPFMSSVEAMLSDIEKLTDGHAHIRLTPEQKETLHERESSPATSFLIQFVPEDTRVLWKARVTLVAVDGCTNAAYSIEQSTDIFSGTWFANGAHVGYVFPWCTPGSGFPEKRWFSAILAKTTMRSKSLVWKYPKRSIFHFSANGHLIVSSPIVQGDGDLRLLLPTGVFVPILKQRTGTRPSNVDENVPHSVISALEHNDVLKLAWMAGIRIPRGERSAESWIDASGSLVQASALIGLARGEAER